jgi:hypothetical protein
MTQAPAGPGHAPLEAAAEGPDGVLNFVRWWAFHGGLVAAYQRECAEFVRWLQPGVKKQRLALRRLAIKGRMCGLRGNRVAVDHAVRAIAHEVHGLAWDIGEFRRLHWRAERGLEVQSLRQQTTSSSRPRAMADARVRTPHTSAPVSPRS